MQRTPTDFYNALPSRKIELHDGKFLVGGSIEKTAMAMSFILNAYGAEYATQYIPKELLEEALIKVYGKPRQRLPIADYGNVEKTKGWNQLKTHLRLSFFRHKSLIVLGPDLVMRLEEDAWTPDIMILYGEHQQGLNSYYVDGPASLIVEMVNSATKIFDNSTRIKAYADGGVPEVWRIDEENQTISQLILQDGVVTEYV